MHGGMRTDVRGIKENQEELIKCLVKMGSAHWIKMVPTHAHKQR